MRRGGVTRRVAGHGVALPPCHTARGVVGAEKIFPHGMRNMEYMIFKESPFEVGGETDAFCASCKADTQHTIVTVFEGEVRSVQCAVCGATHAYRPPRGDVDDEVPEPIAVRRRQSLRKRPWGEVMAEPSAVRAGNYAPADTYREGDIFRHSSFGLGYVSEVVSETKFEGTFEDGPRILVHNRPDLAAGHLAASQVAGRPTATRLAATRLAANRPAANRPAASRPKGKRPAASRPARASQATAKTQAAVPRATAGSAAKTAGAAGAIPSKATPKAALAAGKTAAGGSKPPVAAPKRSGAAAAPAAAGTARSRPQPLAGGRSKTAPKPAAPKPAAMPAAKERTRHEARTPQRGREAQAGSRGGRATATGRHPRGAGKSGRGGGDRR